MPTITSTQIQDALTKLGLNEGSNVLVHSSLSSFGQVEGGADAVIDALLGTVGSSGTVLVPTLTATADHNSSNPPVFDPENSKSWTGRIPETFRTRPDAVRSLHPTHSVAAIGVNANSLTEDHTFSISPCDERSPYGKLADSDNGYVMLIGVDYESMTLLHHVEEIAGVDYHMQKDLAKASIVEGNTTTQRHYMMHQWGTPRDFNILEPLMIERGVQRKTTIGNSEVRLLSAKGVTEVTLNALRSNARFLCKD